MIWSTSVQIIDVHDPLGPVLIGSFEPPDYVFDLDVVDDHVYLVTRDGFSILDVSDPSNPTLLGIYTSLSGHFSGVDVKGDIAYLAGRYGLTMLDISNPTEPQFMSTFTDCGDFSDCRQLGDVKISGDILVAVQDTLGNTYDFFVMDISTPSAPVFIGSIDLDPIHLSRFVRLKISGSFAFVITEGNYLRIVDLTDPASPIDIYSSYMPVDIHVSETTAYLAEGNNGLIILDVSDPYTGLPLLGSYKLFGYAQDVQVRSPVLYVSDYFTRFTSLDVSDPRAPSLLTDYDVSGSGNDLELAGNILYVNNVRNRLFEIFDVSDPTEPVLLGTYNPGGHGNYEAITVEGDYAYIGEWLPAPAQGQHGIKIVDIGDLANPALVGSIDLTGT